MSQPGQVETSPVAEAHRLDERALAAYLADHAEGFAGAITLRQFQAGQSNPTYQLHAGGKLGGKTYVLRKKPPGKLLPSAHAVDREFRVIKALRGSGVPVPRALHLCEDPAIIGTAFFVMEMVEGRVFHNPGLPGVTLAERRGFFDHFIRILATLHRVDVEAVGLSDFGRAGGYLERQISRWSKQYEASKTEDIAAMDQLVDWLPARLPADESVSIVHGDYRPGNTIVKPDRPEIAAVLDWELSTLGHPLSDLGYCCANYHGEVSSLGDFSKLDHRALGIPTEAEFIDTYCRHSGRDGIEDFHWYVVFSLFRSAAIIQGVYKRGLDGNAASKEALTFGAMARERAETAWRLVEERF